MTHYTQLNLLLYNINIMKYKLFSHYHHLTNTHKVVRCRRRFLDTQLTAYLYYKALETHW